MLKNVGLIDRSLRFLLALLLIWLGLIFMKGIEGNVWGILVSLSSLLPLYMVITRSCFVFHWFNIHTLSKKEILRFGDPKK
ncbi:MAG: DUF2892 domain-containing protein [Candidatus Marinimicrobia bacterium]|jgi:hypothetical protein|nr:DUF2892 domain-containing protein [Candidatus Neomarinimicrobiota bacterium]MBT4361752.1 DUF2892 domain-containing protein [Candidatus Neomarinimicrobiota bacterium]MBT4715856.1 DUF2892 domain-containing protein [Candidatus Neomarinimicrobiota bacterium]MBT4947803.1 DUF2892 domain-containing protein [Candidatus Neomarinimicrobiota bacterium]MBT5271290.1 DUF2892 domain-containing protein [Candidatus Neomarinimicrobiota bacterium]